jgi:hypothetical protein
MLVSSSPNVRVGKLEEESVSVAFKRARVAQALMDVFDQVEADDIVSDEDSSSLLNGLISKLWWLVNRFSNRARD